MKNGCMGNLCIRFVLRSGGLNGCTLVACIMLISPFRSSDRL